MAIVLPGINQFLLMWWLGLFKRKFQIVGSDCQQVGCKPGQGCFNEVFHPERKGIFNRSVKFVNFIMHKL